MTTTEKEGDGTNLAGLDYFFVSPPCRAGGRGGQESGKGDKPSYY